MQIEITPELLAGLKEKAKNINPDQWKILYPKDTSGWGFCVYNPKRSETIARIKGSGTVIKNKYIGPRKIAENNAEYIAAANPAVMLAMIAKIERLEKEVNHLIVALSKNV